MSISPVIFRYEISAAIAEGHPDLLSTIKIRIYRYQKQVFTG